MSRPAVITATEGGRIRIEYCGFVAECWYAPEAIGWRALYVDRTGVKAAGSPEALPKRRESSGRAQKVVARWLRKLYRADRQARYEETRGPFCCLACRTRQACGGVR